VGPRADLDKCGKISPPPPPGFDAQTVVGRYTDLRNPKSPEIVYSEK